MKKNKMYKYLGRNGNIVTSILLEKIDPIPMVRLIADEGKVLTNGTEYTQIKDVFLDEAEEWSEIDKK
jgi:hypothetical protein